MPITLIAEEGNWEKRNTQRTVLPIGLQIITPKLRGGGESPFALGTLSD